MFLFQSMLQTHTITVRGITEQSIVPAPGDIVTAMVTVVNHRFCKCSIKCVGDIVLTRPYKGILRKEDVRAVDKDRVEMYKSYRPGDIILARVLPMTEAHTYQLSTAENELGVAIAHSEEGVAMVPVSWTQMQCPKSMSKEFRKVAKIVPEHVVNE
ncbi:Exosome complex component CSL4 [Ooceraea biroi]|uniref:Exosome complex component CSL4 n=1 Tax=Ooceraea biroi TaxID=2015173 RepID=A0A026WTS8_OOCBI|nr:Exosome complex component CSL4 [Ooceraea biroi]